MGLEEIREEKLHLAVVDVVLCLVVVAGSGEDGRLGSFDFLGLATLERLTVFFDETSWEMKFLL